MRRFNDGPKELSELLDDVAGRLKKGDLRLIDEVRALWPRVFDPVLAGPLSEGVRLEPHTEMFGANVTADEVQAILDRFPETPRGQLVAEARAA